MRTSNELSRHHSRTSGGKTIKNTVVSLSMFALLGGMSAADAREPDSEVFGPFPVQGEVFYECNGFNVLNDYTFSFVHTDYYDKTGNVVRQREFLEWTDSTYYRSDGIGPAFTGQVEKTHERINFLRDENLLIIMDHGYMIKPPHGGVIFMYGGRLIFELMTEELVSLKGRIDDVEAAERLCTAFAMSN